MPILTFTATHAANEGLAIGLGSVVVWSALERRSAVLLFSLGAALLTKAYFLAFLAPIVLLLFRRDARRMAAMRCRSAAGTCGARRAIPARAESLAGGGLMQVKFTYHGRSAIRRDGSSQTLDFAPTSTASLWRSMRRC